METEPQDVSGPEDRVPELDEDYATPPKPEQIEPTVLEDAADLPDDVKTDEIPDAG